MEHNECRLLQDSCLGEDDEGGEARGGLPDEAGVGGEPGDVALVAAVEEDGAAGARPPAGAAHEVPLLEELLLAREAEVVQPLPEVPGLELVAPDDPVSHLRPRPRVGGREAGRREQGPRDGREEAEEEEEQRKTARPMHGGACFDLGGRAAEWRRSGNGIEQRGETVELSTWRVTLGYVRVIHSTGGVYVSKKLIRRLADGNSHLTAMGTRRLAERLYRLDAAPLARRDRSYRRAVGEVIVVRERSPSN